MDLTNKTLIVSISFLLILFLMFNFKVFSSKILMIIILTGLCYFLFSRNNSNKETNVETFKPLYPSKCPFAQKQEQMKHDRLQN